MPPPPLLWRISAPPPFPLSALRILNRSCRTNHQQDLCSSNPNVTRPLFAMKSVSQAPINSSNLLNTSNHHQRQLSASASSSSTSPGCPNGSLALTRCFSMSTSVAGVTDLEDAESRGLGAGADAGESASTELVVVSFYKFADFPDHSQLRKPLKGLCEELRVSGGIILAPEGINGSICGLRESVEQVLAFVQSDDRLKGLRQIESPVTAEDEAIHHGHTSSSPVGAGEDAPFRWDHVRVKLKQEIVSLGMPSVKPVEKVGTYVSPKEWNELIKKPDTVVIDVRNTYETRIGKFKRAVDPETTAFREFPSWVGEKLLGDSIDEPPLVDDKKGNTESNVDLQGHKTPPKVAMYCTGGIRCEKASSYLLSKGVKEVYHLQGGILKYLEEIPQSESLWEGECFVFDKRVSVQHGLAQGTYKLCYGCKQPVSDEDMASPMWEYGVSCPHCFASKSVEEKERARARQRQFQTFGVIGGPDKGRRPTKPAADDNRGIST